MATRKDKARRYREMMEEASAYVAEEKPKAECPNDVATLIRPLTQDAEQETFFVILLNTKNCVIKIERITVGLVDRAAVHAREVFRSAIVNNSSRLLLCHNHPSGDPTPSAQDIACTRSLVEAGKIVGIEVLDHVVLGNRTPQRTKDYLSFREENLI